MVTIFLLDLKRELISKKTFIVSLIFIIISVLIAKYSNSLALITDDTGKSPALETLLGIYEFIGFLLSSVLFSGIITKEIESETCRYLTPYISKKRIFLAKYFLMVIYFVTMTLISIILLFCIRTTIVIQIRPILNMIIFFMYTEALVILISCFCNKERLAILVNLSLSLILPLIFTINYFKENIYLKIINFILPYKYLSNNSGFIILIFIILAFISGGLYIFERKEI